MVEGGCEIALSELIGAMSYTLGLTEGEPPGHAARSCLIGMRLGDEMGLPPAARSDPCHALLLKDAGCSANSAHLAALCGWSCCQRAVVSVGASPRSRYHIAA